MIGAIRMKKSVKCFLLYSASLVCGVVVFFLLIKYDADKAWALALVPPCAFAWGGLIIWNGIPVDERPKHSKLFYLDKLLYGLPIGLTLSLIFALADI